MFLFNNFIDHSLLWYLCIHKVMDDVNRVLTQMRKFTEVCSTSSSSLSLSFQGQWLVNIHQSFPLVSLWLPVQLFFLSAFQEFVKASGLNSVCLFTWGFLEYQHYFITFSLLCQQLDKLWWKPWLLIVVFVGIWVPCTI